MYLNLAASWKDLAAQFVESDSSLTEEQIDNYRRVFYCGAFGFMNAQSNILRMHERGEARIILIEALMTEAVTVASEIAGIADE
jgi:hypothetical protein